MKSVVLIFVGILLLTAEVGFSQDAFASVVPNGEHQEVIASLNENERVWFQRFQEGYMMVDGWQQITSDILARTPTELQQTQKIRLEELGNKIGLEWCRDNTIRKVDTAMLKEWGALLRKTAKKEPDKLGEVLAHIDQEVDSILE